MRKLCQSGWFIVVHVRATMTLEMALACSQLFHIAYMKRNCECTLVLSLTHLDLRCENMPVKFDLKTTPLFPFH